jgi:hypothetical protein
MGTAMQTPASQPGQTPAHVRRSEAARPIATIANVLVGKPDTTQDSSAHTFGIHQGNEAGRADRQRGFIRDEGIIAHATAARSTGINADKRNPIDPRMPNLSPP